MPDIALIGEKTFLYEKLFEELGATYQFLQPSILGSPFLPRYKMVVIPTGFANTQYSQALKALRAAKSEIASFIRAGGIFTVYGALVPEHDYDWLPLPLKYVCEYSSHKVKECDCRYSNCACMTCTLEPECDGYLIPGEEWETVLKDEKERPVLAAGKYGEGLIIATSIHEFPTIEYLRWALKNAREAKI